MKIVLDIPDEALFSIIRCLKKYEDIEMTLEELKALPKMQQFFKMDISEMYFQDFEEGLFDVDFIEYLGLKKT